MKALLFLGGWLAIGVLVAVRGYSPGADLLDRMLAMMFWPFFLGRGTDSRGAETSPLERLRLALGDGDAAQALVDELAEAINQLQDRHARIERALTDLGRPCEGAMAEAREASRMMLIAAADRAGRERDAALAAIEEAATRLYLAREAGEPRAVEALLRALKARLSAGEELAG